MKIAKLAKKTRWSRKDAELIVAAWRRSGQTQTGFAADHGCSMKRLSMWKNRLDGAACVPAPGIRTVGMLSCVPSGGRRCMLGGAKPRYCRQLAGARRLHA